jgi:phage terminase large subunit-like protein
LPEPFTFDHFESWISRLILDNGEPWRLEEFQAEFLSDLFSGPRENWLIVPEGNGKTTLIAGLALYGLRFAPDALIPVAASSRDQARIMYRQAKGFIRRSKLDDKGFSFEPFDGYRRIDLRVPGKTKRGDVAGSIEIHAADAGTGDGIIPFPFAILDELHRHKNLDLYETWRGKLDKRDAQIVTISTAGEAGGEFEETREKVRQGVPVVEFREGFTRCRSNEISFHEHALEAGGDPEDMEAVKRANPLPSITVDSLRAKRASVTMSPQHWARFVCNVPTRPDSAAISEIEWLNATTDERIPGGAEVWLGIDLGWKYDTTAVVPLWWRDDTFRLLGEPEIIVPPRTGEMLHPSKVKRAVQDFCGRYRVSTVVMDMTDGADIAAWLSDDLDLHVIDRAQTTAPQAEDYDRFTEALRNGFLRHTGDLGLKRHVLNAVAYMLPDGGAKFRRPSETRQGGNQDARVIDALVAAAMVHSYAVEMNGAPRPGPMVAFV